VVRTLRLQPGNYDVSDFPFVQGSNDVDLVISDASGRTELLSFSVFVDRTQLASGRSEYGFYLGVESDALAGEIEYASAPVASGFYRRGLTDNLTAGSNFQYIESGWLVGAEGVWGSELGTFGGDAAFSDLDAVGSGWAVNVSYERLLQDAGGGAALQATFETRSRYFGAPTQGSPDNRYAMNAAVSYSRSFGESSFAGIQMRYAVARDGYADESTIRATYGHRLSDTMNMVLDASWTDGGFADGASVRVSLVRRFGSTSSARAEYDSQSERARFGYQTSGGQGTGAWSAAGSLDAGKDNFGFNGAAAFAANRAELGLAHTTAYAIDQNQISDQRTSLRAATAIAFAGGRLAIGRPVNDGFAIVAPYAGAPGTIVEVESTADGYYARSGLLGPALYGQIGSYSPRTVTYDAPFSEGGFDIGTGALRVLAPYHAGYVVTVGSDYTMTAIGRLLDSNGEPVTLLAGEAVEIDGGQQVEVFTNRQGVFGMSGLRPGRWRIELGAQPARFYDLTVPESDDGMARVGDLRPVE
jgi:outer membrane usher protein